jgi:hypothetical protein
MPSAFGTKTTQSGSQSGTQTSNLDPMQSKLNKNLFQQILAQIQQGPQVNQGDRNAARGQVNQIYGQNQNAIEGNLAARGFSGGKLGEGIASNELQRAGALSSTESSLRDQAMNRFQQMIQNAFQFDQPRSFSSSSTYSGTGTQQPGLGSLFGDIAGLGLAFA